MTDVLFPALSKDEGSTGVVVTWFVEDGEEVAEGALVAEVAVDKVDQEVVAPASGVLTIVVPEEQEVGQGGVIATIA